MYPFNEETPFWNLLTRRKQYYEEYIFWLEHMRDSGLLELPDDYDPRHLSMFHFCFVSHGRHKKGAITKSHIYKELKDLLLMLDECEGFRVPVEVFYRYMSDKAHSNLVVKPDVLKHQIL